MDFLLSRRSRPAKLLSGPAPDRATLERILEAGGRVPDHGKLEPWRFVVLEGAALARVATAIRARGADTGQDGEKAAAAFEGAPVAIIVVGVPKESEKIPADEQVLSAGCAAFNVLTAALASGWGANWLTGWIARDPMLLRETFGLEGDEWIAGFIHIGTCETAVPERPRPDMDAVTRWVSE
ncbi:nitroreductase family protein [Amaricoccus macauensis]|uniref:nitroreductase family protein n=1 Tax=Amaricoccus macauensis TaxID=57001 RepID=UPI003C7AAC4D